MARATLLGSHSHPTLCGVEVHVYMRRGRYLARGRFQGQAFGQTLGVSAAEASAGLRHLQTAIEDGTFVRPSERRSRPLAPGRVPRLSVRQLIDEFLTEKRKTTGQRTADTYQSRLLPVLDFAERPAARRKWPLAADVNRDFAVELRSFLHQSRTTRNGRPGGLAKSLSTRQIFNILECLRGALAWARRADVRKLPADWSNPLTADVVGARPAKDPLREDALPAEVRAQLVAGMDRWQLCQLSLSLVLPLRPGEAAGLLVSDVDFGHGWLTLGTRLGGGDFTKGGQSFKLPFPPALRPILRACIGGRAEGPLLRRRAAFAGRLPAVGSRAELEGLYEARLAAAPAGGVLTQQDRKREFRALLRELGGAAEDRLTAEFQRLAKSRGLPAATKFYDLRGAVTTAMARAKVPHLELRYFTGHTTRDILNAYVCLDPVGAIQPYFETIAPLLAALTDRARQLGIPDEV